MTLSFTSRQPLAADEPFEPGVLLVTAGAFQKRPFIRGDDRKAMLLESLDFNAFKWKWRTLAFVILDNHYHLVLKTPGRDASRLAHIIQSAHSFSAYHWRRDDPSIRSRIWWNFWDTPIENRESLIRHINYLHANPTFHGFGGPREAYRFSSLADYVAKDPATLEAWERDYPASELSMIDSF